MNRNMIIFSMLFVTLVACLAASILGAFLNRPEVIDAAGKSVWVLAVPAAISLVNAMKSKVSSD